MRGSDAELLDALRRAGIPTPPAIDIGGGLGIRYAGERTLEPERYASAVLPLLAPTGVVTRLRLNTSVTSPAGVATLRYDVAPPSG